MTNSKVSQHIYSPEKAVDNTIAFVEAQFLNPVTGIKPLIPGVGDRIDPWKAGDCVGILAYTSNGKSSFVSYVVNQHGNAIRSYRKEHPDYNHIIVYVSWEQPIEQMIGVDFSRALDITVSDLLYGKITESQIRRMKESGVIRKGLPVWLVGHSLQDKRTRPRLSMAEVSQILEFIEDELHFTIDLIVLDYLQRIRWLGNDKVLGIESNCDEARSMAIRCPVLLLSQAGRQCFERQWSMPILSDSQWSSNFEQSCTHMYGLWRPTQNKLEKVTIGGKKYTVQESMLLLEALKQTLGPIGWQVVYELGYGGTFLREWGVPPVEQVAKLKV